MKVKDLIEELKKFDGDMLVLVKEEHGNDYDEVDEIYTSCFSVYKRSDGTTENKEAIYLRV